jgi:GntR family transcriptional regulator
MTIDEQLNALGGATGDLAGSPIAFRLDPSSGVPTYLQLVQQVEQALRLGYLTHGDRLPTVKEATEQLAINPNTVLKAYRELEHRGLAAGRPGQGTFIEATLRHVGVAEQAALATALRGWMGAAAEAGLDDEGMTALFTAVLRDFRNNSNDAAPGRRRRAASARSRAGAVA